MRAKLTKKQATAKVQAKGKGKAKAKAAAKGGKKSKRTGKPGKSTAKRGANRKSAGRGRGRGRARTGVKTSKAAASSPATTAASGDDSANSRVVFSRVNAPVKANQAEIAMKLNLNYNNVASNPDDLDAFIKAFVADTSRALKVDPARISVVAIQHAAQAALAAQQTAPRFAQVDGSNVAVDAAETEVSTNSEDDGTTTTSSTNGLVIKFQVLPPTGPNQPTVDQVSQNFAAQAQNPSSALNQSPIISKTDSATDISITNQQPATKPSAAAILNPMSLVVTALAAVAVLINARGAW